MQFRKRTKAILFFLLFCSAKPAAWGDQVVLTNGDRVTGSIVNKDEKNLTIKTDLFGLIVTPWDQVESIVTEKPLNIVFRDGRTLRGTLKTVGANIEVTAALSSFETTPADPAILRPPGVTQVVHISKNCFRS